MAATPATAKVSTVPMVKILAVSASRVPPWRQVALSCHAFKKEQGVAVRDSAEIQSRRWLEARRKSFARGYDGRLRKGGIRPLAAGHTSREAAIQMAAPLRQLQPPVSAPSSLARSQRSSVGRFWNGSCNQNWEPRRRCRAVVKSPVAVQCDRFCGGNGPKIRERFSTVHRAR